MKNVVGNVKWPGVSNFADIIKITIIYKENLTDSIKVKRK